GQGSLAMKIVRVRHAGQVAMGLLDGATVTPLPRFGDMQSLIQALAGAHPSPSDLLADAAPQGIPLSDVRLLAPIVPQRNVLCVGWNYLKHFDEGIGKRGQHEVELPKVPTFFSK